MDYLASFLRGAMPEAGEVVYHILGFLQPIEDGLLHSLSSFGVEFVELLVVEVQSMHLKSYSELGEGDGLQVLEIRKLMVFDEHPLSIGVFLWSEKQDGVFGDLE